MNLRRISLAGLILPMAVLADAPDMLVNAQGEAQRDISIRGSSYTGAGIAINGINLKVPGSSHHHAERPMCGPLLSDPEVRLGPDNVSGHLTGTAALETNPLESRSSTHFKLGTDERYGTSIFSSTTNFGGCIEWEKALNIDYDANGLERRAGGAFMQWFRDDWQIDLLGAGQTKEYDAQGYYGIPSSVYAEERTEDALMLASAFKGDLDGMFMRAGASLREFDHEYAIPSAAFSSDVLSRYSSLMLEGRTLEIQNIALYLRSDVEHGRISGDMGHHDRTRGSIVILPEARFERITVKGGLNSVFQTDESAEWLPQAGIDFFATDNIRLYASYSESVQQPDFQMLYYTDPYHIGDTTLPLQHSANTEIGLHQFLSAQLDWQAALFHRRQENATDWIKATAADTAWVATDLGSMDVTGIDAKITYLSTDRLKFQLYYQWISKDDYDVYSGLYELDYPEHLLALAGYWPFAEGFELFGEQTLRWQTDNNYRSGNDFGADASVGLHWLPRFAHNARLSFRVDNLWGSNFQAIPGLKPRDLAATTGITVNW